MSMLLTQAEFDRYAADWATFINQAKPEQVLALFVAGERAQLFVSFDLYFPPQQAPHAPDPAPSLTNMLSTMGIAGVHARFVLLPEAAPGKPLVPRFGLVLYAVDELGGRISAYYQGSSEWQAPADGQAALTGLVPFNLIRSWLLNWTNALTTQHLTTAVFGTAYGPLQGYNFELSDFLDLVFAVKVPNKTALPDQPLLRACFGLKTYYPAHPENLRQPSQTFGLVLRLFAPDGSALSDAPGSPSADMAKPKPPG